MHNAVLFGMTGMGNAAFEVLTKQDGLLLKGVLIPARPSKPFPYYDCECLHTAIRRYGVDAMEGLNLRDSSTYGIIKQWSPDVIIVANFNQIIPMNIIRLPKYGVINIHPSLLPKYRGATPTTWVLKNGEESTGVTGHFIEDEKLDQGRIIEQKTIRIEDNDNDGMLREKLAQLSQIVLRCVLEKVFDVNKSDFSLQDESVASFYPKRTIKDSVIDINQPFRQIVNTIRATTPFPGARLLVNGSFVLIDSAQLVASVLPNDQPQSDSQYVIDTKEGPVQFQFRKEIHYENAE